MLHSYTLSALNWRCCLLLWVLLAVGAARAQAPQWEGANYGIAAPTTNSKGAIVAAATDAQGNIFVTGNFSNTITLGSTTLTSAGGLDLFVAKYVPATGTWAWAQRGGGTDLDQGIDIAVSGTSIYVIGSVATTSANGASVSFGGTSPATSPVPVRGASVVQAADWVLAKYQDNGTSAALLWTQVGGGTDADYGTSVAVSGSSIYVTGSFVSNTADGGVVLFGGSGTTAGTITVRGASSNYSRDLLVAKYADQGSSASLTWTQVAGGTDLDNGSSVAVQGNSVYVTGAITNTTNDAKAVVFGGNGSSTPGTFSQRGATSAASLDLVLAKYLDQGSTSSYQWSQVGGGTSYDGGSGVAVQGSSIYVTGFFYADQANSTSVLFGGSGSALGTTQVNGASAFINSDLILAKYLDNGSTSALVWTQVGGGTGDDYGNAVAVRGSTVLVAGSVANSLANSAQVVFGGNGTASGTATVPGVAATASSDGALVRYDDTGSTATFRWGRTGGGSDFDNANDLVLNGQQVYVAGYVTPTAAFGPTTITGASGSTCLALARLTDPTLPLATAAPAAAPGLALYPNPTPGRATLTGAAPGQPVQVLDALGHLVATTTTDASGAAQLVRLPAGLYLVQAGAATVRLTVE